jgi:hypothetical protein
MIDGESQGMLGEIFNNYHHWDTLKQMGRVTALRYRLIKFNLDLGNNDKLKAVLYLDLALEALFRTLIEKILHVDIGYENFVGEVSMILTNLTLSYNWEEIAICLEDWNNIVTGK